MSEKHMKKNPVIDEYISRVYPDDDIRRVDGFDDCAIGVVERCGQKPFMVYDREKIIKKMTRKGMSRSEAVSVSCDQEDAWIGDGTPGFVDVAGWEPPKKAKKQSVELEIELTELTKKRRYGLILRAVTLGLIKLGIKGVSITMPETKGGRLAFKVER